ERYLAGGNSVNAELYEEKCEHSSQMEKKAADAERASVKYKQAEYLVDKVGQKFYGVISGVSKWGIFVVLDENFCEGMVSIRSLTDDFYELDEDNYQVVGHKSHQKYKLGDRVQIKIQEVDLNKKQMNFVFVA
ncbi:MAG: S1 RNA-binding domain-containing protein, partial [Bacteroidales bacterium]